MIRGLIEPGVRNATSKFQIPSSRLQKGRWKAKRGINRGLRYADTPSLPSQLHLFPFFPCYSEFFVVSSWFVSRQVLDLLPAAGPVTYVKERRLRPLATRVRLRCASARQAGAPWLAHQNALYYTQLYISSRVRLQFIGFYCLRRGVPLLTEPGHVLIRFLQICRRRRWELAWRRIVRRRVARER